MVIEKSHDKFDELTNVDFAYIAGIIDGEGFLSIRKHKDKRIPRGWSLQPQVGVWNTDEKLITYLNLCIKGTYIRNRIYPSSNPNAKPSYLWMIQGNKKIKGFLESILPYLIIKKERAEILLKYIRYSNESLRRFRTVQKNNNGIFIKGIQKEYSDEEISLFKLMKDLNKRGIKNE